MRKQKKVSEVSVAELLVINATNNQSLQLRVLYKLLSLVGIKLKPHGVATDLWLALLDVERKQKIWNTADILYRWDEMYEQDVAQSSWENRRRAEIRLDDCIKILGVKVQAGDKS